MRRSLKSSLMICVLVGLFFCLTTESYSSGMYKPFSGGNVPNPITAPSFISTAPDGSRAMLLTGNTTYTPGAGTYGFYVAGSALYFLVNGTGYTFIFPASGKTLMSADFSNAVANANSQQAVVAPTYPNSTAAYVMQGLAGTITPTRTGNILIIISGTIVETTGTAAGVGILYQLSYGTGVAPTSNSALAGTQVGTVQEYMNPNTVVAADVSFPFSIQVVVTGLTLSTAYWIDLAAKSVVTASYVGFVNVSISIIEF